MPVSLADSATGSTEGPSADAAATLTMDAQATLFLNGNSVSTGELAQKLPRDSSGPIRIRVDRAVAYEHLNRVLAILSGAGFQNVSIITRPTTRSRR